ncbi:GGDEF domain-containing protein [uncultured Oceanisphaera sp.]|uniref:sensor domain-containing diguanylate cyclase n=1 Tax=uncultured Oceanisphaera sp. TaxID=353858 RepID=UPI00261A59A6|nr:PAS domain S-box protein [uncultured Oceanisphaera sp.]
MRSQPFHLSVQSSQQDNRLARSIFPGAVALLLVMTVMLAWGLYQDYRYSLQSAGERLQTQLRAFGSAVDIAFVSADHVLHDTRHTLKGRSQPLDAQTDLRRLLLGSLLETSALDSLTLYHPDGRVAASAGQTLGLRHQAPGWVIDGLKAGSQSFTGIENGRLGVAELVRGPEGQLIGVLLAMVDPERIDSELESGDGYGGQHLMLLDNRNRPLMVTGSSFEQHKLQVLRQLDQQFELDLFSAYGTRLVFGEQYLFAIRQLGQQPIRAFAAIERERVLAGWTFRALFAGAGLGIVLLLSLAFLQHWRNSRARERQAANDLVRLYQAIEQVPSPIMITDLDRRIIYVNRVFLMRSGYSSEEVLGQKPNMLSSGQTPAATYQALQRELKLEQTWQGEFINRMRDGSERVEQAMVTPVRDVDGRVVSYFAISHDVTEQREFEARLYRYREIVNAADELMALVDTHYCYQQVNRRYLDYHHRERDEIEGHAWWELYGDELFNSRMKGNLDTALKGTPFVTEGWIEFKGAGRRFCRMTGHPITGDDGHIESVAINIADLTERKQSEEALRSSEARFRALSEFSPMGIFESDASGRNIYSNRYFCDMLGASADKLRGFGWTDMLHPEDLESVLSSWQETMARQHPDWYCEGRVLNDDNQVRWFRCVARRYDDPDASEARYIGIVVDITGQVEHQAVLERKNRELERLSTTDVLTGLANRGRLEALMIQEIHRYERYGTGFAIVMLDVDHFKQVNDSCGHQVGDQVLRQLADLMRLNTRLSDCPGRWGGEEFLIICPNTGLEGARQLAESLRRYIEQAHFPVIGHRTCSFGVAAIQPGDQSKEMLKRADDAMYRAKSGGRNRVEVGLAENVTVEQESA